MDPTSRPDTSLLEYARHYGIAEDPISKSGDTYLMEGGLDNIFPDTAPEDPNSMRERQEELDSQLGHYLNHERLNISMQEGRLLGSIRELERESLQHDWNELLPPLKSMGSWRVEPLLKTQEEEERARELGDGDAMDLVDENASSKPKDGSTLAELEKKIETAEESLSSSRQSSISLAGNRLNRRATHNTVAFVETVLSISKTDKDGTPPRSNPAMPSPTMRHSSIRTDLGSLDAFMESRGIIMEPSTDLSILNYHTPSHLATSFGGNLNTMLQVMLTAPPPIPEDQRQSLEDQVLYLSSDLLKTHLLLIQSLETLPHPPRLVYRDYDVDHGVEDADIIVPPTTGIILTTAQALTQRPLPGEDMEYECPVLSRIYRIAPRYEHFYVLAVCAPTVDQRTADALAFLKVFCGEASDNAKIIPHKIVSGDVVDWVLAIAFEKGGRE